LRDKHFQSVEDAAEPERERVVGAAVRIDVDERGDHRRKSLGVIAQDHAHGGGQVALGADALPGETPADSWYAALEGDSQAGDASFLEARSILVRAVRTEAPVAGSLTLLRLKRARSRDELVSLLDEVEQRIVKPHRSLAAMQTLRRARVLLDVRIDSNLASA